MAAAANGLTKGVSKSRNAACSVLDFLMCLCFVDGQSTPIVGVSEVVQEAGRLAKCGAPRSEEGGGEQRYLQARLRAVAQGDAQEIGSCDGQGHPAAPVPRSQHHLDDVVRPVL